MSTVSERSIWAFVWIAVGIREYLLPSSFCWDLIMHSWPQPVRIIWYLNLMRWPKCIAMEQQLLVTDMAWISLLSNFPHNHRYWSRRSMVEDGKKGIGSGRGHAGSNSYRNTRAKKRSVGMLAGADLVYKHLCRIPSLFERFPFHHLCNNSSPWSNG